MLACFHATLAFFFLIPTQNSVSEGKQVFYFHLSLVLTKVFWKTTCPLVRPAFFSLTLRLKFRQSGLYF